MGTSTIFRRLNDLHTPLAEMPRGELEKIDSLSPLGERGQVRGWSALMELHNGNVEALIWWRGRLFRLRDAPKLLSGKAYDRYSGKHLRVSEWTLLKRYIGARLEELDKEYKKEKRKQYKAKRGGRIKKAKGNVGRKSD